MLSLFISIVTDAFIKQFIKIISDIKTRIKDVQKHCYSSICLPSCYSYGTGSCDPTKASMHWSLYAIQRLCFEKPNQSRLHTRESSSL